jgi:hypothetical protein
MIELVTHCYAHELSQYAAFFRYQISSLLNHTPAVPVQLTVCWTPIDKATANALAWGKHETAGTAISIKSIELAPDQLFRRSIGRNCAALESRADLVWFTDVDHYFGPGCLDTLLQSNITTELAYPQQIMIHKDHATGDVAATHTTDSRLTICFDDFIPKTYNRAIGGVQIVHGDYARFWGYLKGHSKYQSPRHDGRPFGDFKDDVTFRRQWELFGGTLPLELPGVYRLRHSKTTYQG